MDWATTYFFTIILERATVSMDKNFKGRQNCWPALCRTMQKESLDTDEKDIVMNTLKKILAGTCFALLIIGTAMPAAAQNSNEEDPYLQPDETWISISGKAVEAQGESFTLDYGEGTVTVEMDDWDWYNENAAVLEGDKVTVYGMIDDDLYETTKIEASSVYVENLGTYFYASAADEDYDDDYAYWVDYDPIVVGQTIVRGTVTSVSGREFTIDAGVRQMTVDTSLMAYNPMDDMGYQQIDTGDYVSVSGDMEADFWENQELMAASVVTLDDD